MGYYVNSYLMYGCPIEHTKFKLNDEDPGNDSHLPEGLGIMPFGNHWTGDNTGNLVYLIVSKKIVTSDDGSVAGLFKIPPDYEDWYFKFEQYGCHKDHIGWYVVTEGS